VTQSNAHVATHQGFGADRAERLPLPTRHAMSRAQRTAAEAIVAGPRKAIFGPFVSLLQSAPSASPVSSS
jgi:4-carboxymuconolactone decarboxylase